MPVTKTNVKRHSKLLVFVTSLALSLLVAESMGRMLGLLPVRPSESYVKLTQEVGRLPVPFSRSRFSEPGEFDIWLDFNAMGFRDPRVDFPEQVTGKRILAVGDSFATAWEVALDQRWTEQMHRFRSDWAILNVGMRNWGIDQTYLNLVNYPLKQQPDIVLLMFFTGNDVSDNYRSGILKTPWDAPHFLPTADTVNSFNALRKVPWSGYKNPFDEPAAFPFPRNINTWLRLNSVVYRGIDLTRQFIQERAQDIFSEPSPSNTSEPSRTWGVFRVGNDAPEWQTAWQITEVLLREMKTVSQQRKAQFVIVIAPLSPLIEPDLAVEQVKAKELLNPAQYDLAKPAKRLAEFGKENDIPVLDLAPGLIAFRKADSIGRMLFFPKDGHFTPLGNCVVAGLIVNWLDPVSKVDIKQCS